MHNVRRSKAISTFLLAILAMVVGGTGLAASAEPQAASSQEVTISGVLSAVFGDPPPGSSLPAKVYYVLTDAQGQRWNLSMGNAATPLGGPLALNRANIQVTGNRTPGTNQVSVRAISPLAGGASASPSGVFALSGSQKWATVLCKFSDRAAEPQALSFFDGIMSSTKPGADDYWKELSYNTINLSGSAQYNWQNLPQGRDEPTDYFNASGDADLGKLAVDCANAQDGAVDFSQFSGINFIFNDVLDCCAWGGGVTLSNDGGPRSYKSTWMPPWAWGTTSHGVLGQEMGHGFGMPHEGCQGTTSPYDSSWDVMSGARQVHINADFKDRIEGWIPGARRYLASTSANQIVDLERLALPGNSSYLMAKIPIGGSATNYYVVEARKFAGYDQSPQQIPGEGVVIHIVDTTLGDKQAQVVGAAGGCSDPWQPGELFKDAANNISIGVVSESSSGYAIAINPTADVAVTKTATPDPAIAGSQLTYNITATNNGAGPAVNVILTDVLPSGTTYVSSTVPCANTSPPAGERTCNLGSILAGASKTFSIVVDVSPSIVPASGATTITNTVVVATDTPDTDLSNNSFSLTTTVVDRADLRLTKECKPDQPNKQPAGVATFCEIYVDNLGPADARNVVITDRIIAGPAQVTITGITSTSTVNPPASCLPVPPIGPTAGTTITCTDTVLPAGARDTIKVTFVANDTGDVDDNASVTSDTPDPNTANNAAVGKVSFLSSADLSLTKTDSPDPVFAGQNLTWTITVTNNGPSTALNAVLKDALPAQVTGVSVTSTGNTCTAGVPGDASQPLTCNMGNIANGGFETATIIARVLSDTPSGTILFNQARVTADSPDPDNSNNIKSESTTVSTAANLALTKTDSPDPVLAGNTLKYELTITNTGPSNAGNVTLTDSLPPTTQVTFVSATIAAPATGSCVYNPLPNTVSCSFNGSLTVGPAWKVLIEVTVNPSVPAGTVLNNTATASSSTPDPTPANNTNIAAATTVNAQADLKVTKTGNFQTAGSSKNVVYTITVTNLGPSDAQAVAIVDSLPSTARKFVFVFVSDPACSYSAATHQVTCAFGTLAAGASRSVDITMNARGNLGNITNTVTVTSTISDPNPANNTASKTMLVKGGT